MSRVRQFRRHLGARVGPAELADVATWTTAEQLALFTSMHVADRRHGLDVVGTLRAEGINDGDVLLAGLLHDAGKGSIGLWPRVAWSLGEAFGSWVWRLAGLLPPMGRALAVLAVHADRSAELAAGAGCGPRTVALIRQRAEPVDHEVGERLRLADEAN